MYGSCQYKREEEDVETRGGADVGVLRVVLFVACVHGVTTVISQVRGSFFKIKANLLEKQNANEDQRDAEKRKRGESTISC